MTAFGYVPRPELMIAEPVGNQPGLGVLGFCYVPYHFVYDLAYPVLIQMYLNDEIFQFPVVVFINKNRPREPIPGAALPNAVPELCQNKNTKMTVSTYNNNLEPITAEIKYKCFDTTCRIGETELTNGEAILSSNFPQCKNGYIIASSPEYETKKEIFSTINEDSISLFLDRKYKLNLELEPESGNAIITFTKNKTKDKKITTIAYPEQKEVELSFGQYEIKVFVYSNSSIRLQGSSEQKCIEIPKSGVIGIFGFTEEKCFDLEIPSQTVNTGISGGGTQNYFISESEIENAGKIILGVNDFTRPTKVEDLQINFNRVEISGLNVRFE